MLHLKKGIYFGSHQQELCFENLLVTDTVYTHEKVDWHYHENAYFTYLIKGKLFEANKKESYHLQPGSLLFHNWQDSHYNLKEPGYTQGFHIELEKEWFERHQLVHDDFEGSFQLDHPLCGLLFDRIYWESKQAFPCRQLSLETLLLQIFAILQKQQPVRERRVPAWVPRLKELLHEEAEEKLSLQQLSHEVGIHPVHLSTEFPRYFHSGFGAYMRQLRLQKAANLLQQGILSLTEITFICGFADQSHFTRQFKQAFGMLPSRYRKIRT